MQYPQFLTDLFETGKASVPLVEEISSEEQEEGDQVIERFEAIYRLSLPGMAPVLQREAARWAGMALYRACSYLLFRDVDPEAIDRALSVTCPADASASVHYSVDFLFRFLSDVYRFAAKAAQDDPLNRHLLLWGRQWPLSSVGMKDVTEVQNLNFLEDSCLLTLYVDRILARGDRSRLEHPAVLEAAQQVVGLYPALGNQMVEGVEL